MNEQILVPRTLLDPRVRFGLKLEELLGSQPAADEVGGQYQAKYLLRISGSFKRRIFSPCGSCSCQGGHTLLEDG